MDRFDFSPLFRSTIGFDRLTRLVDAATRVDNAALAYPPYNIEKTGEDAYRLTMAVAGFAPEELDISVHENTLFVAGNAKKDGEDSRYLHRGIARRGPTGSGSLHRAQSQVDLGDAHQGAQRDARVLPSPGTQCDGLR